jgi:MoaA/NifB/PqqE/SkfB family radical SAM enzyme
MPAPGDGFVKNVIAWARTGRRFRPSFPRAVQFQTLSACNAKCVFCCHSRHPEKIRHGRMEDSLIEKIIAECSRHPVGRISPYLTNEPLLDKRMPAILAAVKKAFIFPIKTRITTNASLLSEEIGKKLLDARLNQLWISVNGYSEETCRQSMGLDFAVTMRNIDAFLDLKKTSGAKHPKVHITTLKTKLIEPELEKAKEYWQGRDVHFHIHHLDNRSGETATADIRPGHTVLKPNRDCDLFLKQAYIVENGDMIICCHDWRQSVVVGNIARTSIAEVWNSSYFKGLIYEYFAGKFDRLEICRACG